jgi:uncharacterized protein (TIGR02145 family)
MSNNQLKTFVRFDGSGRIVPSSMVIAYSMPKVGKWKEINAYPTSSPTTTTTTTTIFIPTVTIGTQLWTTSNLDVTTYRNGDPIPEVTDSSWAGLTTGAWCYYNNDPANGAIYGKLYNWYAVNDPRGLAPAGYHMPTLSEWNTLITYLGGTAVAGDKMKATYSWDGGGSGTNESGFTALGSGVRTENGSYANLNSFGIFWSSTEQSANLSYYIFLNRYSTAAQIVSDTKSVGVSIRLIKD